MPILNNKQANITANLPYAQQKLGVDLKLAPNGDLEINNLNDISLIAGLDNVAQALAAKLSTELGENRYHPNIGVNLPIGEKTTNAVSLRLDIIRSLKQDPRLDNVDVKIQVNGNVYLIDIAVTILGETLSVPLQFVSE